MALDARSIGETVDAISDALERGGRTIAVVDMGIMLRDDGVLDRLRKNGIAVTGRFPDHRE